MMLRALLLLTSLGLAGLPALAMGEEAPWGRAEAEFHKHVPA